MKFSVAILCLLVFTNVALAASKPTIVSASRLKETAVTYKGKNVRVFCLGSTPGSAKSQTKGMLFTSFAYSLSRTSSRSRSAYARLKALVKTGKTECAKLKLLPTPTPTPTPEPSPLAGNFDFSGNVTPTGKTLFGIPAELSANISVGRSIFNNKCSGCHGEQLGRTFSEYRVRIAQSPMLFDSSQVPDSDLAQLVAYLNRFRP